MKYAIDVRTSTQGNRVVVESVRVFVTARLLQRCRLLGADLKE
jgi:hypothetical protein